MTVLPAPAFLVGSATSPLVLLAASSAPLRTTASIMAEAFSSVSCSSAGGSESVNRVAPARISAIPSLMRTVRRVKPVLRVPSKPTRPTAPPYQHRGVRSMSSTNWIAQVLGAPVTVTAQVWHKKASRASNSGRRKPSTWSTVWIKRLYISIWRRPMTWTDPGSQMRDLSLRSTSVHMVSSLSSFWFIMSDLTRRASSRASAPRATVPEIGQVSTRIAPG
mmetsp:Transcript_27916/g.59763  ORF Transcript_27916/g.59763 Transcript_27916/m.59763 type:complete len:220 (-) Transcript_27916:676-1335(-)